MSGRYSDTVLFAYDTDNNRHLVATEHSYSDGCGYYMTRVTANDKFYEISECVGDEGAEIFGTYLPRIRQNLCKSYFSDTPNESIRILLRVSELDGIAIDHFLLIHVDSVNTGPYFATYSRISCNEIISREYDLCKGELSYEIEDNNEVDAVIEALIDEAEENYQNGERLKPRKFADSVTYGLTADHHLYVVFRESSYINDCGHRSYRAMLGNKCFLACDYNDFPEEDDLTFLYAYVSDYESYFSDAPTSAIKVLLDESNLADKNFTCFVIVDMNENSDGTITAIRHCISSTGVDVREYNIENFDGNIELVLDVI